MATKMALCEISTIGNESIKLPKECQDWSLKKRGSLIRGCIEALSRSPQHWSSYSGYLREIVTLCSSYRRWADLGESLT